MFLFGDSVNITFLEHETGNLLIPVVASTYLRQRDVTNRTLSWKRKANQNLLKWTPEAKRGRNDIKIYLNGPTKSKVEQCHQNRPKWAPEKSVKCVF